MDTHSLLEFWQIHIGRRRVYKNFKRISINIIFMNSNLYVMLNFKRKEILRMHTV